MLLSPHVSLDRLGEEPLDLSVPTQVPLDWMMCPPKAKAPNVLVENVQPRVSEQKAQSPPKMDDPFLLLFWCPISQVDLFAASV